MENKNKNKITFENIVGKKKVKIEFEKVEGTLWNVEEQEYIYDYNDGGSGFKKQDFKNFLIFCEKQGFDPMTGEAMILRDKITGERAVYITRDGLRKKIKENKICNGLKLVDGFGETLIEDQVKGFIKIEDIFVDGTLYLKGWENPIEHRVYLNEYKQIDDLWEGKPKTMLKKVCEAQMYRMALNLGGIYLPEELGLGNLEQILKKMKKDEEKEEEVEEEKEIEKKEGLDIGNFFK